MPESNWLVSSAGRRGHLVAILRDVSELCGGGAIVAIDSSPLSAAGLLADKFEVVPPVSDPAFVDQILEICDRHSIRHVVPTIDTELSVYAAARARFAEFGHEVWVSSPEVVAIGTDKWLFHAWLTQHDLPSPLTVEAGGAAAGRLRGPVIAKPRSGSASIGVLRAPSVEALPIEQLGDGYIVQELAAGYEVTVDFAVDRSGKLRGISARRRLEVRAGEVSKAVTIDHPRLRAEVERFVSVLPGAFGVLNVQVIVDDQTDALTFIELNPRFGGGYPLSWQAGAQFPLWLAQGSAGTVMRRDARSGVVMLRFDQAVFENASHFGDALP